MEEDLHEDILWGVFSAKSHRGHPLGNNTDDHSILNEFGEVWINGFSNGVTCPGTQSRMTLKMPVINRDDEESRYGPKKIHHTPNGPRRN